MMALLSSVGFIIIYLLFLKILIALFSSLVRFFFLGSIFCLCKSCSIEQNIDSN